MLYPNPVWPGKRISIQPPLWTIRRRLVDGLHLFMFPLTQGAGQQLFTDSGPAI